MSRFSGPSLKVGHSRLFKGWWRPIFSGILGRVGVIIMISFLIVDRVGLVIKGWRSIIIIALGRIIIIVLLSRVRPWTLRSGFISPIKVIPASGWVITSQVGIVIILGISGGRRIGCEMCVGCGRVHGEVRREIRRERSPAIQKYKPVLRLGSLKVYRLSESILRL